MAVITALCLLTSGYGAPQFARTAHKYGIKMVADELTRNVRNQAPSAQPAFVSTAFGM